MSHYNHDNSLASLPDLLHSVGYNRQCHQRFATNLHLIGDETQPEAPISQQHHSIRKMSSAGISYQSVSSVRKDNTLQQIESQAKITSSTVGKQRPLC